LTNARRDGNTFEVREEGVTFGLAAIVRGNDETAKLGVRASRIETLEGSTGYREIVAHKDIVATPVNLILKLGPRTRQECTVGLEGGHEAEKRVNITQRCAPDALVNITANECARTIARVQLPEESAVRWRNKVGTRDALLKCINAPGGQV
jgi:hypothetical protein